MSLFESLRLALGALVSNRLRSGLTMLGIIIGVAAVIALVSLGQSFQQFTADQFASIGSNLIFVVPSLPTGPNAKTIKSKPLTLDDANAIANEANVPGVVAVAPQFSANGKLVNGGNDMTISVTGTTPAWQGIRNWDLRDGRFFDETDINSAARVAVLGTATVKKLFDPGVDPIGQDIRVNNIPFRVIGVLAEKGGFGNQDEVLIAPITTVQTRLADNARTTTGGYRVSTILAQAVSERQMNTVKAGIENLLRDRHKVQFQGDDDFLVVTQEQVLAILGGITGLLTAFLALLAGISLLVGGIGIMNIMLVSVTERTREIGLRKAVGARYFDLMAQFLIESVVLSILGGLIGVALGGSVALIAGALIPSLNVSITLPAILLATGVSTAIGVFFGLYPASRAASLDPIEALRYE